MAAFSIFPKRLGTIFKTKARPKQTTNTKTENQTGKVNLDGIVVKDFKQKALNVGKLGEILFVNETNFNITYYPLDNAFLIVITGIPFEQNRLDAEKRFLKELDIGKVEACKLGVYITTPRAYNPKESGINYRLSFCEQ